ncbi:MAG: hypothetical protein ACE5K4_03070 [Candidatus Hydrothermarchaeota archaeon]
MEGIVPKVIIAGIVLIFAFQGLFLVSSEYKAKKNEQKVFEDFSFKLNMIFMGDKNSTAFVDIEMYEGWKDLKIRGNEMIFLYPDHVSIYDLSYKVCTPVTISGGMYRITNEGNCFSVKSGEDIGDQPEDLHKDVNVNYI